MEVFDTNEVRKKDTVIEQKFPTGKTRNTKEN